MTKCHISFNNFFVKMPVRNNISKIPIFLPISASSEKELNLAVEQCINLLESNKTISLETVARLSSQSSGKWRLSVLANSKEELIKKLENGDWTIGHIPASKPKIAYLFPGYGLTYPGMGHQYFETSNLYKQWFQLIDNHGTEIVDILHGENNTGLDTISKACKAIAFTSFAMAKLWENVLGITPDFVLGHSIGEYTAAAVAGVHMAEDLVALADWCADTYDLMTGDGLLVLLTSEKEVETMISKISEILKGDNDTEWIEVAARNTKNQIVVGGTEKCLTWAKGYCKNNGIKAFSLRYRQPSHCRGVEPTLPALREVVKGMGFRKPKPGVKYVSACTGKIEETVDSSYWVKHFREAVNFSAASKTVLNEGVKVFLEIGPGSSMSSMVMQNLISEGLDPNAFHFLDSMKDGVDDWTTFFSSLAQLYVLGFNINLKQVYDLDENEGIILPWIKSKQSLAVSHVTNGIPKIIVEDFSEESFWVQFSSATEKKGKTEIVLSHLRHIIQTLLKSPDLFIDGSEDFSSLGISSLQAIRMKVSLDKFIGKRAQLPIHALLECHTPLQLAEKVSSLLTAPEEKEKVREILKAQLWEDSVLQPHIKPAKVECVPISEVKTILLTGVTGQLAPYILEELTKRSETEIVYCLIRGKNGMQRLTTHLEEIEMLDRISMEKVRVVQGNIYEERMGVDSDHYEDLSLEIDCVVNCAVAANHLAPYVKEDLKYGGVRAVNVIGTVRILEFACSRKTKWVYQGSTIMALWGDVNGKFAKIPDLWPGDYINELGNFPIIGYGISKLVADDLVHQAARRGIPCKSFRFGKIGGDQKTGRMKVMENHFFAKFLHYLIFGAMPNLDVPLIEMSVDACAKTSLEIFFHPNAPLSDIYTLVPPYSASELEIADLAEEYGVKLRVLAIGGNVLQVKDEGEERSWLSLPRKRDILLSLIRRLGESSWSNPEIFFSNQTILAQLKEEFGQPVELLKWEEYKQALEKEGEETLISSWLEFYTNEDSIFQMCADGRIKALDNWVENRETFLRDTKAEKLLGNRLKEIVEHPMDALKREIEYTIRYAKQIFGDAFL